MKKLSLLLIAAGLFAFSCDTSGESSTDDVVDSVPAEENNPESDEMPEDSVEAPMDTTNTDAGEDTPE